MRRWALGGDGIDVAPGDLRKRLTADLEAVRGLAAVERRAPEIAVLRQDLEDHSSRAEEPLVICLVGSTGAGKSTLLNALAGEPIARESEDRPTTTEPTIYAPSYADLAPLGILDAVRYDPRARGAAAGHVFVDAPDLNTSPAHREAVVRLASRSDVLLAIFHKSSVVEEAAVAFMDAFAGRRCVIFVLGRADELAAPEIEALRGQLVALKENRWRLAEAPLFSLSARRAREEGEREPGFAALAEHLRALAAGGPLAVRRRGSLGIVRSLARLFAEVREETRSDLLAFPHNVEEAWRGAWPLIEDDVRRRAAARREDVEDEVLAAAGRQWHGPGGLALRTGTWAGAGFGLGALVARRAPLMGAAVATGAAAAEYVRDILRERRLLAGAGMLPAAADLRTWVEGAHAAARARARRLGLAGAAGAEDAAERTESVARRLHEAWRTTVERDLPALAARCAGQALRLAFDLPLLVLGAYVFGRTMLGYLQGRYIGADFLLSSLVLAAGWWIGGAMLLRRWMRWRVRRWLLPALLDPLRKALEEEARRARARAEEATRPMAEAIERLAGPP